MKVNNKFLNIESKSKKSQIEKEIHEFEDENEENRELYEEYNLENKESNKEEIEDNLKFDDQKIELTKKGN